MKVNQRFSADAIVKPASRAGALNLMYYSRLRRAFGMLRTRTSWPLSNTFWNIFITDS